jgi:hypothetical protein
MSPYVSRFNPCFATAALAATHPRDDRPESGVRSESSQWQSYGELATVLASWTPADPKQLESPDEQLERIIGGRASAGFSFRINRAHAQSVVALGANRPCSTPAGLLLYRETAIRNGTCGRCPRDEAPGLGLHAKPNARVINRNRARVVAVSAAKVAPHRVSLPTHGSPLWRSLVEFSTIRIWPTAATIGKQTNVCAVHECGTLDRTHPDKLSSCSAGESMSTFE